ncbi:hypothetical protein [Sulfitobacter aestuariivivens]|uniref:Uncharacterized protein n=1 Tax=Sulfitobacter aestuariivivens TaxID=2766981 RepID=A0A927HDW3_9RHOB|nr:hypothetical protein [Sulfitobacter aestuariivivens]MBD3663266.1 hypothetical protein [Sulfitobacter aestuariivivens]
MKRALVAAAYLWALPCLALACQPLSTHVWMCSAASEWADAEWDPEGEGTAMFLGDVIFNFTEEFPGHDIGDHLTTLEEQYDTYQQWVTEEGNGPIEIYRRDLIETNNTSALRQLQRDIIEGEQTMSAVILAQVRAHRIMLYVDGPVEMEIERMQVLSRTLIEILDDHCSDPDACDGVLDNMDRS